MKQTLFEFIVIEILQIMIPKCSRIKLETNKPKVTEKSCMWTFNNTLLNNPSFREEASREIDCIKYMCWKVKDLILIT